MYVLVHVLQRRMLEDAGHTVDVLLYATATAILFGLYAVVLSICGGDLDRRTRAVILGVPILCYVVWLAAPPRLSIDVLSYISHGYVRAGLGENPYLVPSSAVATSPIAADLAAYGWRPVHPVSPYGPLITQLETAVVGLPWSVDAMVLAFKVIAVACSVAAAALIWVILGRVSPDWRDVGTAAYLWNPMIIIELAGEGHNDAIMVVLVLLALAMALRRRVGASIIAMAGAVLTKYLPALIAPLQAAYLWRTRNDTGRLARQVAVAAAIAMCIGAVAFAPYWAGPETFTGIRLTGQIGHTGSTPTMLLEALSRFVSESSARPVIAVVAAGGLVIFVGVRAFDVRDDQTLLRSAAAVIVAYVLLASPSYWPWYAVLPVALLALVPGQRALMLLFAMSLGSRLAAPLDILYVGEAVSRFAYLLLTWLLGIGVPLFVLAVSSVGHASSIRADLRRRSAT